MYINLDNEVIDIITMTKGHIRNALGRYNSLCTSPNIPLETRQHNKLIKAALEAELVERSKLRFKVFKD